MRNPPWAWDELILACDVVAQNDWRELRQGHPLTHELSRELQVLAPALHSDAARDEKFRSANSVSRKTTDIMTAHPSYGRARTRGGRLDREVIDAFINRPGEMHQAAEAIRKIIATNQLGSLPQESDNEFTIEGSLLARMHRVRERSSALRAKKVDHVGREVGVLRCEVCAFDFEAFYGTHGKGFIEVHHVTPLHESGSTTSTRLEDLALLCANCHRMCHRRLEATGTWPSPQQLLQIAANAL